MTERCVLTVSADMCGPDALYLILVLQRGHIGYEIDENNPRIIRVDCPADEMELILEDEFKEGWIDVEEE